MFDVIVVGLGAMGSAAAYHLSSRKKRVLGLDLHRPPHEFGSSHGRSRIIRQAYFEHPSYVPLVLRAYELWERLENETGVHLLTRTGGLMIGSADSQTVAGSILSAKEHGLPHEIMDASEIRRRFPPLRPRDGVIALFEGQAGIVRPEQAVKAHLSRASQLGAELHFDEPVVHWEAPASGGPVRVKTTRATYEAEALVLTPGPWAPKVLRDLPLPLSVERRVMFWFEPKGGIEPFLVGRFPIFIWEAEDGQQFYGFPAERHERGVKVALHGVGSPCSPDTIDRVVREEEIDLMRSYLADRIPALNSTCLEAQTCMYTNTPDRHFVIGLHPHHSGVALAVGFSGHGFKFASVVGEILADLVIDGNTRHPISLFDLQRFS